MAELELFPEVAAQAELEEEIACIHRELRLRRRVYAERVEAGQMKPHFAAYQLAVMGRVLERLQSLRSPIGSGSPATPVGT
jgi:hypothetical protein